MSITQEKMYFYESIAHEFDSKMNMYDTNKRVAVVFDELLTEDISDKFLLDAGCGTGWFSKKACERKARVVSMDLGEGLLAEVRKKCKSTTIVGSILDIPFADNTFDIIVSSEVIEHVPDPYDAMKELYRVLKPGGLMVLTTPNKLWYFSVWIANKLKLRPYQGLEHWTGWFQMSRRLREIGFQVVDKKGIHILPFVSSFLHPFLDMMHRFSKPLGALMVNIAVKAQKPNVR